MMSPGSLKLCQILNAVQAVCTHNTYYINSRANKIHHLNLNKNLFYRKLSNYNRNRGNGEKGVGENGAIVHL